MRLLKVKALWSIADRSDSSTGWPPSNLACLASQQECRSSRPATPSTASPEDQFDGFSSFRWVELLDVVSIHHFSTHVDIADGYRLLMIVALNNFKTCRGRLNTIILLGFYEAASIIKVIAFQLGPKFGVFRTLQKLPLVWRLLGLL